ncbi:MAG: methyltransferase domain-containing protein [Pseudomonadota bacterium]
MAKTKLDTQAIGLDAGLKFMTWLTGAENLHYGLWTGIEVNAGNFGDAQEAYTKKLFEHLPNGPLRILDIGGGAGEAAKKLVALGHKVEIVVPSKLLAERCAANAPGALVHEMGFEDFTGEGPFDLCLFSESYQYIPLDIGLAKCLDVLSPEGAILIADCFRAEGFVLDKKVAKVGGGHRIERFRALLESLPVRVIFEEDITEAVAPSVDIEQELFNVLGYAITRVDSELSDKRPFQRNILNRLFRLLVNTRSRARLDQRLNQKTRTSQAFCEHNRYLMLKLVRS